MKLQNFNLKVVRKLYEKEKNYQDLNDLITLVIEEIINNGINSKFDFKFFKKLEIDFSNLEKYESDNKDNLEKLLYELVLNETEPKEKIINLALQKCKWSYLIDLVNRGFIPIEEYEKELIISLPKCSYQAIFTVPTLNINKIKRTLYDACFEENISFGYYHLFALFIANTSFDKYNLAFAKKMVNYPNDDINHLIIDTLKFYLKNNYKENLMNLKEIFINNYEQIIKDRPDILLIYVELCNRLNNNKSNMDLIFNNYINDEENNEIIEKIANGEEKKVAFYIDCGVIQDYNVAFIIDSWISNKNSLAISTYLAYLINKDYDYENVGEKLDQIYITKSNERLLNRKKDVL